MVSGCFLALLGIILASFWTVESHTNPEDNVYYGFIKVPQGHDLKTHVRELLENKLQDFDTGEVDQLTPLTAKDIQSISQPTANYDSFPEQKQILGAFKNGRKRLYGNFRPMQKRIMGPLTNYDGRKRDNGRFSESKRILTQH